MPSQWTEEDGVNMRCFLYEGDDVWAELNCYQCANGANKTDRIGVEAITNPTRIFESTAAAKPSICR